LLEIDGVFVGEDVEFKENDVECDRVDDSVSAWVNIKRFLFSKSIKFTISASKSDISSQYLLSLLDLSEIKHKFSLSLICNTS
jgi:hypothetical protein